MARRQAMAIGAMLAVLAVPASAEAGWAEPVPHALNADPDRSARHPHMAAYGRPLLVWDEETAGGNQIRAAEQQPSGAWSLAGPLNANPAHDATDPTVAVWTYGLWVAWRETKGSAYQLRVRAGLDGPVSPSLNVDPNESAYAPYVALVGHTITSNTPYVAWEETGSGGAQQVYVKSWDGNSWEAVGAGSLNDDPAQDALEPAVADVNGTPWVAWREDAPGADGYQVRVKKLANGAWVDVGGSLNVDSARAAGKPSIINVGRVPYVTWTESNGTAEQVRVKRFDGTEWDAVGGSLNVDPARSGDRPVVRKVGADPMVVWTESDGTANRVRAKILRNGVWRSVGGSLSDAPATGAVLANSFRVPYAAWVRHGDGPTEIRVKRLEPDIVSSSARPRARSAVLSARVDDFNVRLPIGFELGTSTANFGTFRSNYLTRLSPGTGVTTISRSFGDLRPDTHYFFRAFGSEHLSMEPTSVGAVHDFRTIGRDRITGLRVEPRAFKAGANRSGTVVSYTGSNPANTTFVVQRDKAGRYFKIGSFTRRDARGFHRFVFRGVVRGLTLPPGRYRFKVVPRNDAGKGPIAFTPFRVKR